MQFAHQVGSGESPDGETDLLACIRRETGKLLSLRVKGDLHPRVRIFLGFAESQEGADLWGIRRNRRQGKEELKCQWDVFS